VDLVALGGENDTSARASTRGRADRNSLLSASNGANYRSDRG
jgi:hypothetical protein